MTRKRPEPPKRHTDSYIFMQSMFQQDDATEKRRRRRFLWKIGILIALSVFLIACLIWFIDLTGITVTRQGIFIPFR